MKTRSFLPALLALLVHALPLHAQTMTPVTIDYGEGFVGGGTSHAVVAGNPAMSYYDEANGDLKFARNSAADGSGTWTTVTVDTSGLTDVGEFSSLVVMDNGLPAIAYSNNGQLQLKFARNSAADGSGTWTITTVDATGLQGLYCSLAIINGKPAISYYSTTDTSLKYARNSAADGSGTWTLSNVELSLDVGRDTSLAEVDGKPAISYYDATNANLKYARNSAADGSGTWTLTTVDTGGTGGVGLYTSLKVVNGRPAISYWDLSNSDLKYARNSAVDGSGTWTITTVDSSGSVGYHTSLAVVDGTPAISYYDSTNTSLKFARNSAVDGSGTWTATTVENTGAVGSFTSLAVVNGQPAISYHESGNGELRWARNSLADGSGTWTPVTVDTGLEGVAGSHTSQRIVAGRPAIAYLDQGVGDLKYVRNDQPSGTGGWWFATVDASSGIAANHISLATLASGHPVISYYYPSFGDLKFARNSAANGSGTWTVTTVESGGIVGQYTSLAIVGGNPAISYHDVTNGDLKFARNSLADGSGTWTPVIVDNTATTVGQYTSLAIVGGNPAISYYDVTNSNLKFARNSAADGSGTWTLVTVDNSAGQVGQFTSMAVVNGNPAITYYDVSNTSLKFARNSAPDGSGTWTISTVDNAGAVGQHSSLAVVDGRPAISYYEEGTRDLKFIHALDANGATWAAPKVLDSAGTVGQYSSMAVIDLGWSAISYFDTTNGNLKWGLVIPPPEIVVEQPAGTSLTAGTATINMGISPVGGTAAAKTFTIKNTGVDALTLTALPATTGGNAGDFAVNTTGTLLSIPGGQETTFAVTLTPTVGGPRSTTLRIVNDDPDESTFDITLDGTGLTNSTDTDSDGLNDVAEFNLAALGFDWEVSQPALVNTLTSNYGNMQSNLNTAGFFTTAQVQALHVGTPLLEKSGGTFKLTLRLKKATTLSPPNFLPFAFTEVGTVINGQGEIEYEFAVPEDAAFFRIEAE